MRLRPRSRWLRWARNAGLGLLALVALVLGGVHAWLRTDAGRSDLLARLTPVLDEALGGRLTIGSLDAVSAFGLRARAVQLRAPDGQLLASVERLAGGFSPLELLFFGRVHVTWLKLDGAFVDLGAPAEEGG